MNINRKYLKSKARYDSQQEAETVPKNPPRMNKCELEIARKLCN